MTSNRRKNAPADFAERFVENVNALVLDEARAVGRLLDWVGVASDVSPLRERALILVAEYLSRTGQMDLDEALVRGRAVMNEAASPDPEEPRA